MSWHQPLWWFALMAVAALALALLIGTVRHRSKLRDLFGGELYERVLPGSVRARRLVRDVLVILGLIGVVLALVEPRYGKEVQQVDSLGVDIAIAVDLSLSMDARDVSPSRLERAKREIFDLMDVMEGDRLGLVIFAGGAFPRLPLTTDVDAIDLVVQELSTDMFTAQGSEMGEAIRTGLSLLDGSDRPAGKAILILSDGETHNPADALAAAQEAKAADVRVYGLLIGQDAAPIPTQRGVLKSGGQTVMTTPDDAVLRDVARITGGATYDSVASNDDMLSLYQDEMRSRLVASTTASLQRETWRTGYQWPLGVGLFALLVAALLGDGKRRWGAAAAVFLAVHSAQAGPLEDADALFQSGDYRGAAAAFTDLTVDEPSNAEAWERLGASQYKLEDFDGAARSFDEAVRLGADADAAFNSGNAHYQAGRLTEALDRYDRVLAASEHAGATNNRDILVNELQARAAIQPPPPPQEGDSEDPPEGEDGDTSEDGEGQDGEEPQEGESGQQGEQGEQGDGGPSDEGQPSDEPGEEGEAGDPGEPSDSEGPKESGEGQERQDMGEHGAADLSEGDTGEEPDGEGVAASEVPGEGGSEGPVSRTQAEAPARWRRRRASPDSHSRQWVRQSMVRALLVCLLALAVAMPAWAAPRVALSLQTDTVQAEQTVNATVVVVDYEDSVQPPSLVVPEGLTVDFVRTDNRMERGPRGLIRAVQFIFQVTAAEPGEYVLGPAEVVVDGVTRTTQTVTLTAQERTLTDGGPPVVAFAEFSEPEIYEGEIAMYHYGVRSRLRLYRDYWTQPPMDRLTNPRDGLPRTVEYVVDDPLGAIVVKETWEPKLATAAGDLGQTGATVTITVAAPNSGSDGWGLRRTENMTVTTEPAPLTVKPLPPAPPGFAGLVGDFTITGSMNRSRVRAGDSVTYEVVIVGDGSVEGFALPEAPELDNARFYDNTVGADAVLRDGKYVAEGRWERVVVPTRAGELQVPPMQVITFSPTEERYVTHTLAFDAINVRPGSEDGGGGESFAPDPDSDVEAPPRDDDIRPIYRKRRLHSRGVLGWLVLLSVVFSLPAVGVYLLTLRDGVTAVLARRPAPDVGPLEQLQAVSVGSPERLGALDAALRESVRRCTGKDVPEGVTALPDGQRDDVQTLFDELGRTRFAGRAAAANLDERVVAACALLLKGRT